MTSGHGQTVSFRYKNKTFACVIHHSCAATPRPNPASGVRRPLKKRTSNGIHANTKPTYSGHERLMARRSDPATKVRSNSNTMTGAEAIISLQSIPDRQVNV